MTALGRKLAKQRRKLIKATSKGPGMILVMRDGPTPFARIPPRPAPSLPLKKGT